MTAVWKRSLLFCLFVSPLLAISETEFTSTFPVKKEELLSKGHNRYFILIPGYELVYEGKTKGDTLTITVLDETKVVDGVETRVVEEKETENGELIEISRNYFAISKQTNDLFYFGEEVDIYKDGKIVNHNGSWISGVKGAQFGLMMPGSPVIGMRYQQEIAPDVAMDRAEIISLTERVEMPAGEFEKCLKTKESTPLEKGESSKLYAPQVGLIQDGDMKLVKFGLK